jgi:predicted nucleic acid-binding protein
MFERLQNKYAILDTNVLIYGATYSEKFAPFFNVLEQYHVKSITSDAIIFEFLRGAQVREHLEVKIRYLKLLLGEHITKLPINPEIFETARKISNIYSNKDISTTKQISIVDCIIAAQLKKYNESREQLFLITTDNKDYPLSIFDRIGIYTIDADKEILNLGIYCWSAANYDSLVSRFDIPNP